MAFSVSPCLSKWLPMHIALSNECLMCAAQRQGSRIFSYLPPSSRAHWAAQCSCVWMCVCVCTFKPHLSGFMSKASKSGGAHVHLCLQPVWDVQLSGSATGGECWSVSLLAPSLPPHMTTGEILTVLIPSHASSFLFPPSSTLLDSALPLYPRYLLSWEYSSLLAERETLSRCLCKNVALTFLKSVSCRFQFPFPCAHESAVWICVLTWQ